MSLTLPTRHMHTAPFLFGVNFAFWTRSDVGVFLIFDKLFVEDLKADALLVFLTAHTVMGFDFAGGAN